MLNRIFTGVFLVASAAGLAGCGASASDMCQRADECNVLRGQSVDECTDTWSKQLDDLSDSKRADCEKQLDECLSKESCDNFEHCDISDCF